MHGIDHRGRWYSRDRHRGEKELAIDLDVGGSIRPVLTPEDPDSVIDILRERLRGVDPGDPQERTDPPNEGDAESWVL